MKYRYCYQCGNPTVLRHDGERSRIFCPHCQQFLYENPLPSVAAVIVNIHNQILLIRRKYEPGKGGWCLPGGFIETGETPEQAVVREVLEETGIIAQNPRLLTVGTHLNGYYGDILIIGYLLRVDNPDLVPQDDAAEARFFSLAERPGLVFPVHEDILQVGLALKKVV